jgi:urease accessory protein
MLAHLRLMQMTSQAFPIGGYSHSLGLESAIETGVVKDEASVGEWITEVLRHSIARYEAPMLREMHVAWAQRNGKLLTLLNEQFLASRESAELRAATVQMGVSTRSLLAALPQVDAFLSTTLESLEEPSLPLTWSGLAHDWQISASDSLRAYLWSWAENQALVAMKSVPIGQSAGQRVLLSVGERISDLVETADGGAGGVGEAAGVGDAAMPSRRGRWSNFAPGLAILCSQHETQYSRLFRS